MHTHQMELPPTAWCNCLVVLRFHYAPPLGPEDEIVEIQRGAARKNMPETRHRGGTP